MKYLAYAKLNLALHIAAQRADGYHELDMIMQRISLYDEIQIHISRDIKIASNIKLPADNTLCKAARLFFEYTKIDGGADIFVQKNIPVKAGLGGGSSDGATVLVVLNQLYGTALGADEMRRLGLQIGADVPFFIEGECARVQGIGEVLKPVKNNMNCIYLLIKPALGVSTKLAYEYYHKLGKTNVDIDATASAILLGDVKSYAGSAGNSLMPAAIQLCPDIQKIIEYAENADFSLVTGSGSCVFFVYTNKITAEQNAERFKKLKFVEFIYIAENK